MISETKVYEILTKKKFNRDEPYLKNQIKERIRHFISKNSPIKLVGFWGVGFKNDLNWADLESIHFLKKLDNEIKSLYPPGIEFTFIFSDEHGVHNGVDGDLIYSYTKNIEKLFKKHNFKFIYLSTLWKKYKINFNKINEIHKKKDDGWWVNIPHSEILEKLAKQRNHKMPSIEAAQKYVIMRTLEKEMLEKEFSNFIIHTYSGHSFDFLLPHLPRLYLYSYKKGRSNSPWFITDNK